MSTVVEFCEIYKTYHLGKTEVPALRGISLAIASGEFVAIAGPSGSGKTSALNLIGCIDKPTAGRIIFAGQDVTEIPLPALAAIRREKLGFIFQTFNLIPVLNAYENVEYPLLLRHFSASERKQRVMQALERVGIADRAKHKPNELSGGQRQRVAIARALVGDPAVVLADEPTANLDSVTAGEIIALMRRLNEEQNVTFIFSTHDTRITQAARRLIHLRDGRIAGEEVADA
ncbi:MAG: ABC transporter ATP-binding protein [candidate division KSB1 bacterium]|nr:ABC transporter ATP-binding protein [candidate division KSB1 bacterium]MDZ7301912.1 ABC transporter ATP-binding protein [candidate division KSB1 bacterium]MDZ7314257.1 ABC transporter ATP-binding protein [candidate division KSB1 bacterium]